MAEVEDVDDEIPPLLLPCVSCTRTFRPEALAVHSKVCEKTLIKKRKKFDSFRQRVQGTELAEYLPVLPNLTKKPESSPVLKQSQPNITTPTTSKTPSNTAKSRWKDKHNELLQTIHTPAAAVKLSDHERCPYCERSFGPKAYDRHLEWCREQQVRVQPKSPASQRAKERLEARTKYRAPLVAKGKQQRSASRDKHSSGPRDPSPAPSPALHQHAPRTPATARKKIPYNAVTDSVSTPNVNQNFVKGTNLRSSTRTAPSAAKKTPQTRMSRFSRSHSSLRLNTEDVNDQVPEMSVTGFGRRQMYLDIPVEVDSSMTVPYRLISTYDLDFPDDFVGSSRPPSVCRENQSINMSPVLPVSSTKNEVDIPELNKTYTEDDLKELMACNPVKPAEHEKLQRKKVKKLRADKIKNKPKTAISGCEIYDDLVDERLFKKTILLDRKDQVGLLELSENTANQVNLMGLSKKTASKVIAEDGKQAGTVQYITQVRLVPNAACIVLEVEKLSSKCDPGPTVSNCKSYSIYSQPYLPQSFNQITLEFPGVNLIRDRDLFRNYVFCHVILQRLDRYDGYHNLKPMTEAFGLTSDRKKYGSSPTIAHMDKYCSTCFTFSGCCAEEGSMQKSDVSLDRDSINPTSPKIGKRRSKVRSSRTFTKVVHNWWDPTPPKKVKRFLSPDSITTEKSLTSESETYWDYYDINKNCENIAVMPKNSFLVCEIPRKIEALSPRYSENSSEDRFVGRVPKKYKENSFNYYTLCSNSKAPEESSCESVDSRGSFEEDSLNQSSDCSVYLEEVRWNNKQYFVPSSSTYGAAGNENAESVQNKKPCYCGKNVGFNFVSGIKRTDEMKNYSRIYSEETTTVVEVETCVTTAESSSSVHLLSTNAKQRENYSKHNSKNAHGKSIGTSWSVERVQVSTKSQYEYGGNIFNAQGSSKPVNKANFSTLPQINNVNTKSTQISGVPINTEIGEKRTVVVGDNSSQSSYNSSSLCSKFSSKLPVLQHRPTQAGQSNKTHWTNKHLHSKEQSFPPKELNKPSECKKMYDNLRAFAKAPVNKDTDLFNFRRKLSPIAGSESISCSKSFSSEQSSAYDNMSTSFVDELEDPSNTDGDRPYQIKLEQPQDPNFGRDECPERSTLLTFRVSNEKTFSNHFVLPEITVEKSRKKEKCLHCGARYKQRTKFPNAVKEVVSRLSTKKNNHFFPIEPLDRFPDVELQPAGHPTNGSDSAYSSLNRKSPVGGEGDGGARFCHECGAKYPLAGAKFCCQCGVRRLIL